MKKAFLDITDKGTFYIFMTRLFVFLRGPLSIFFIAKFLTKSEQGVWYTFASLSALYILAELGFSTILSQYVSHEYAHLSLEKGKIVGDESRKERLFVLIKFAIKLYGFIIPVAITILLIIGYFYFHNENSEYFYCWILYTISSGATLFLSFLQSVYQGLDKVKDVEKQRLIGQIFLTLFMWFLLSQGVGIWSFAVSSVISNIIMSVLLLRIGLPFWNQAWKFKANKKFLWRKEMIKLQGRYAISWFSGYIIFNLITPVIYKMISPEVAGQYGFTMTAINAINGFTGSWFDSKTPHLNILVSKREVKQLNTKYWNLFFFSLFITLIGYILFYIVSLFIGNINLFEGRFLISFYILLMIINQIPNIITINLARYLRAHKEEPYVYISIIAAINTAISTFIILPRYGFAKFLLFLIILSYSVSLPIAIGIFINKKKKYDNLKIIGV